VTDEALLQETAAGLAPAGDGWFVVNVRDTEWMSHDAFGSTCVFESGQNAPFRQFGINIRVVWPG
jgi:hypothetical protein